MRKLSKKYLFQNVVFLYLGGESSLPRSILWLSGTQAHFPAPTLRSPCTTPDTTASTLGKVTSDLKIVAPHHRPIWQRQKELSLTSFQLSTRIAVFTIILPPLLTIEAKRSKKRLNKKSRIKLVAQLGYVVRLKSWINTSESLKNWLTYYLFPKLSTKLQCFNHSYKSWASHTKSSVTVTVL